MKDKYEFQLIRYGNHKFDASFRLWMEGKAHSETEGQMYDAFEDTAPMAICLAALKAVEKGE